jgi:hypothetical protein
MRGSQLALEEPPAVRARIRRVADQPRRSGRPLGQGELAALDRQRQARPAGLDVGLLQRPVALEETRPCRLRRGQHRALFGRREHMPDERRALRPPRPLYVDTAVEVKAGDARHQALGMRQVEPQPAPGRRKFRAAVAGRGELPVAWPDTGHAGRQQQPEQGMGRRVGLPVGGQVQPGRAGPFDGRQHSPGRLRQGRAAGPAPAPRGGRPYPGFAWPDPVARHQPSIGDPHPFHRSLLSRARPLKHLISSERGRCAGGPETENPSAGGPGK